MAPKDAPQPTGGGFGKTGETAHPDEPAAGPPAEQSLDDALKETFPASDPISPGAAAAQADEAPPPPAGAGTPAAPPGAPVPFPTAERMARDAAGGKGTDPGPAPAPSKGG